MINHRQLFLQHVAQTSKSPVALHIIKADGCHLTDVNGMQYIDLISGIAVSNLGHNHPAIIEAIKNQADRYLHVMVYGELIQSPQTLLAQKIAEILNLESCSTYFVNSGAEAVEGAIKLAKRFTGRPHVVALKNSYHGSTQGALSLMSNEYFTAPFRPLLPGVSFIDPEKPDFSLINQDTSCVILELIKTEEGCKLLPQSFLEELCHVSKKHHALVIIDECQTGLGRTGSMFAHQNLQLYPDILILGKAFGGGLPLGAFVASNHIMQALSVNPILGHITTFGGHPLCCAAALALINELQHSEIINRVAEKEQLFRSLLLHPKIRAVSGKGLLLSVELGSEQECQNVIQKCLQKGLFIDWFLFAPHCIRIAPPLTISPQLIQRSCEIILNSLD
jgi:acetylornithine/succinyldiaminopimelate/putrescine aminotransferase